MLFNSYAFILLFLPIVLAGFYLLARFGHRLAAGWLVLASVFFYGWWDARYVVLLLASIALNYIGGLLIGRTRRTDGSPGPARSILLLAIGANLLLLAYYKYTDFFIGTVNDLSGANWTLHYIVLPLGISFFSFTQIAFLVDTYRGLVREYDPIHYVLFVSYFPHLIAGPVLHHKQMMPQFHRPETYRFHAGNFNIGMTIFVIGLFKKVLLADQFAQYADPVFGAVAAGSQVNVTEAWLGALAYTFQLYFDFSAYSDMAIGLSKMFNVDLPANFNSPYKSLNIIDFWRRWHITLSTFLRDYLYFPLGGNRLGTTRRYVNLVATMVLGGLWHGANWTFVVWGTLHGGYLVVNHGWQALQQRLGLPRMPGAALLSWALTFLCVVIAWVLFRAVDIDDASRMLQAMAGLDGALHRAPTPGAVPGGLVLEGVWMLLGLLLVRFAPNSAEISDHLLHSPLRGAWMGFAVGAGLVYVILNLNRVTSFIYFNF